MGSLLKAETLVRMYTCILCLIRKRIVSWLIGRISFCCCGGLNERLRRKITACIFVWKKIALVSVITSMCESKPFDRICIILNRFALLVKVQILQLSAIYRRIRLKHICISHVLLGTIFTLSLVSNWFHVSKPKLK